MGKTILEHAAYELTKSGMTDHEDENARRVAMNVMALVRRFERQKNDKRSAEFILEAFERICRFMPLTPLTDDPDEWEKFEMVRRNVETNEEEKKIVWQSKRSTSIFSEDEGKTFYDQNTGKTGNSVDHVAQAKAVEDAKKKRMEQKAAAEARAKSPNVLAKPPVDSAAPAGEVAANDPRDAQSEPAADAANPAPLDEAPADDSAKGESPAAEPPKDDK